nr:reverse transcriptase domain-containing protein [Tanacetum cinerariifolium]
MSTNSFARNLFLLIDNPELRIQRRSRADPTLLNDIEMVTEGNGDPPVPDLRTIEELCQPTLNGRGGLIALIAIQHLDKFLHVTQSIKVNGVTDDALRLYLFSHSLTLHATVWFDRLLRNSINTFEQMDKMLLEKCFPPSMVTKLKNEITNFHQRPDESLFEAWERYKLSIDRCGTFMKRRPEECYDLIENITAHHNDWDTSAQRSELSSFTTSSSDLEIVAWKAKMAEINKNLMKVLQVNQQVKAVAPNYETCGGPHSYNECPTTVSQTQNVYATGAYQGGNSYQPQGAGHGQNPPPANQASAYQVPGYQALVHQPPIPQPQVVTTTKFINYMNANDENLKGITTQSGTAYQGPTIPTTSFSSPQVVERETEVKKDTVPPTNNGSTKDVTPLVVQIETPILNCEPVVAPVSALKPNQKLSIPYPSRLHDQKLRDKANDQKEKLFKIFQDLNFNISFADALILLLKFGLTIKSLLTNKDKVFELARTLLNEHCSIVLLKKLPEKVRDHNKFLISCDFLGMDECLALTDLGASIYLMPLSVWNKLSLPELTPTFMTLELANQSISRPIGVAEYVFVKVGKFHFLADFVVIDFDADPRVPLILERSFLKIERDLIDVYTGELTL